MFVLVSLALPLSAPAKPLAPTLSNDPGQVLVKGWAKPIGKVLGYNLYMSTDEKVGFKKVNDAPISDDHYLVRGLIEKQVYYFTVTSLVTGEDGKALESAPSQKWPMLAKPETPDKDLDAAPKATPSAVSKTASASASRKKSKKKP
jgi:hypothetical protein